MCCWCFTLVNTSKQHQLKRTFKINQKSILLWEKTMRMVRWGNERRDSLSVSKWKNQFQRIIKFFSIKIPTYFYTFYKQNNKRKHKRQNSHHLCFFYRFFSYLFFSIIFFSTLHLNFYSTSTFCKLKSKFSLHCFYKNKKYNSKGRRATLGLRRCLCVMF